MNKIKKLIIFILFLQTGAFAKAPTYDTFEYLVKEFQKDIKQHGMILIRMYIQYKIMEMELVLVIYN